MVVRQSLPSDRSGSSKTALTNVRVFDGRGLRALGTVGIDGGPTGTDAGRARGHRADAHDDGGHCREHPEAGHDQRPVL
jgi:hypothetical protein